MAFEEKESVTFDARNVKREQKAKMLEPLFEKAAETFVDEDKDKFCIMAVGNSKNKQITCQFTGNNTDLADLAALIMRTVISKTITNKNIAAAEILMVTGEMLEQVPEIKKLNPGKFRKLTGLMSVLAAQLLEKEGVKENHEEQEEKKDEK